MNASRVLGVPLVVILCGGIALAEVDFIRHQSIPVTNAENLAVADLDGDGDTDIFLACGVWNEGVPNRVYFNRGDSTFTDSGQRLGNLNSFGVSLADLDRDGDIDAFVANGAYSGGNPNKVWLNDGAGRFTDSGQNLGHNNTGSVALADLDGDGDLDAFACNHPLWENNRNVGGGHRIWLNDGTGRFTDNGQDLGNAESRKVSLGDIDADGDVDALIANYTGYGNKFWLNDGTGRFTEGPQQLGTVESREALLADLDGDGDLDAFVTHLDSGNPAQCPNRIWLNQGDGTFQDSGQRLGRLPTTGLALRDLDLDGDLDAFVINSVWQETRPDEVWLNDGSGRFTDSGLDLGDEESRDVALADLDGDTDLDAVVIYPEALQVFINVKVHDESLGVQNTTSGETHLTVQRAINQAEAGDTIEMKPGLYREKLDIDKDIVLKSVDPNDSFFVGGTIIQGDPDDPVVTLSGISSRCCITGLTLRAGRIGIAGSGTNATICNCRILDNVTHGLELFEASSPHLLSCLITGNGQTGITMHATAGRHTLFCEPVIEDCIIADNSEADIAGGKPVIIDSLITRNGSDEPEN